MYTILSVIVVSLAVAGWLYCRRHDRMIRNEIRREAAEIAEDKQRAETMTQEERRRAIWGSRSE